ncbi:MAG: type II secretion system F family protein [Lentisphaerae bacterium]|nr:type II secretion system F family protein [Lentisphaerota bacterium]
MALYLYKAIAPGEKAKEVTIEAENQREAEQKMRRINLLPVKFIREVDPAENERSLFGRSRIDVLDLTEQLATLLNSAIPLERSLAIIAEGATVDEQREFIQSLRQGLHEGRKFSELIRSYGSLFPGYYANLIETGEETGRLPEVLEELRKFMTESRELKDFIVTSSIYPIVVLAVAIAVTILMFVVFVPRFVEQFQNMGRALPGSMVFLMNLSDAMIYGGGVLVVLLLFGGVLIRKVLGKERTAELKARFLLSMPLIGSLHIAVEMGKFVRTLAILISNHVDIIKTVRIATRVIQNPIIRSSFNELENKLKSGLKLSSSLEDNEYLPKGLASRLRVGEESGTSGDMLMKAATHVEEDTRRQIKRLLSMFEPLVIVALALVVMTVVLAIFMAIMELNSIES